MFSNDDSMAAALQAAGTKRHDPVWRLPLWPGYDRWLTSSVADLNNVGAKPLAGAIVAALYLQRFISDNVSWIHLDTYAWNDTNTAGRPEGGEALGMVACFDAIYTIFNLGVI
jgi:leucyl aminopeptidase